MVKLLENTFRAINNGKLNYHHKIVHENLRLHPCKECDMDFKTPGSLKRHVQVVHEGMKPFECTICHTKFGPLCLPHVRLNEQTFTRLDLFTIMTWIS